MILAIDQGTTGTTCIVYDERAQPVARAYREHRQHFPQPGWVEHDAREIWETAHGLALQALAQAGARPGDLAAIGITNQRETVCVWDPVSGEPLHRAIVWQDRRGAPLCERLRGEGREPLVRERTGLVLDPYFSATKISWLLENVPDLAARARVRARARGAVFGTIDSWLIFKLTGRHLTDATNASRTLLYDIAAGRWDPELLDLFDIPAESLPEVRPSAGPFATCLPDALGGYTAASGGRAVPVAGVAGDQQAALFGQACLRPGQGKNTYGTGSFVLLNTGSTPPAPTPGLLSTVAWTTDAGTTYALEGAIFATGAAVQWLRDGLRIIADATETQGLAESLQANDGVYFVPALTGLGSPHWDPHARGTIVGLTRGAGRAHLARATLEAIAYQTVDAVRAMESAAGQPLGELRVDGGASANAWLMQFQADVLDTPVLLGQTADSTAFGAALLAGVGAGAWGAADVPSLWSERMRYEPRMSAEERQRLLAGWGQALERARSR
ncbi:MAG TPA: glycerol kinase GlpK [Solirubrobacteraceae bacterium]|nr:glycerol kinase GlpK [Solirubrobacteraceae bacterium]